jgi:hypothetical protein
VTTSDIAERSNILNISQDVPESWEEAEVESLVRRIRTDSLPATSVAATKEDPAATKEEGSIESGESYFGSLKCLSV